MSIENKITDFLKNQGVDFIHFVDISKLSEDQNKGFTNAILFGMVLSPAYLKLVFSSPNYIKQAIKTGEIQNDEFHLCELRTDKIADDLSAYIHNAGYGAYSQSEANIEKTGHYNKLKNITPLPHKTIALMANMGWIGKHNLLVTKKYGSGISMCTVLSNAPLKSCAFEIQDVQCGNCNKCVSICPHNALTGNNWYKHKPREHVIDVHKCKPCYQCVVHCPHTLHYVSNYANSRLDKSCGIP